jgi:hypothetical protein
VKDPKDVERDLAAKLSEHAGEATARVAADVAAKLADAFAETSNADWAFDIVVAAAWRHQMGARECVGWTMTSAGRAWCGKCGWQLSGRMEDAGQARSGAFALCALGRVGQAFQFAQDFAVAYAKYHHGDQFRDVMLDGAGGLVVTSATKGLHSDAFVHTVDV